MNITDTSGAMPEAFDSGRFQIEKWKTYADAAVPGLKEICLEDLRETMNAGYSWQEHCLPVLNAVMRDTAKREKAMESFRCVTDRLDEKIIRRFRRTVNADIILYLGLCNGAGWVTTINGTRSVLLGIEKIMELDWCDTDAMTGLIVHELGHVYQDQYGVLHREFKSMPDRFLWKLFTEGIAMVFEQEIAGDPGYFHQDRQGWKQWCDNHVKRIAQSFSRDLESMSQENQRYFGDWVSFDGHSDTGYYLGARFVRFLLEYDTFDRMILYGIREVKDGFSRFVDSVL